MDSSNENTPQFWRSILKNFSSLSWLQIVNYLVPLIVFPYLVRVIGPSKYGLINIFYAIVAYLSIIIDYGFNLTASRSISLHRSNHKKIEEIFNSVIIIKSILLLGMMGLILISIYFIPYFDKNSTILLFASISLFAAVFIPFWFFQGIEDLFSYSLFSFIGKVFYVIAIFVFVKIEDDYVFIPLINSLSQVLVGIISVLFIASKYKIRMKFISVEQIIVYMKEGWFIFCSNIMSGIYANTVKIVLGIFTSNEIVGYFSAADRIRNAFQSVISALLQSVYPRATAEFNKSIQAGKNILIKLSKIVLPIILVITLVIFFFSEEIIVLLLGEKFIQSSNILRMIIFLPVLMYFTNVFGVQILLGLNEDKLLFIVTGMAALLNLILLFILTPLLNINGAVYSLLLTELFAIIILIFILQKKYKLFRNSL